jgi:uncharacterized protein
LHIQLQTGVNANLIRTYGLGQVTVNQDTYHASLIVMPDRIVADWSPQSFQELAPAHLELFAGLGAELVLLGTGRQLRFPRAELLAPLVAAGVGWEIMDTGAACRTYNILMGEGRRVAAALLMID